MERLDPPDDPPDSSSSGHEDQTIQERVFPPTSSMPVTLASPIAAATSPARRPATSALRLWFDGRSLRKPGRARRRESRPGERSSAVSGCAAGSGFGSAFGLPGIRICWVAKRPRTVSGRPDILVEAFINWTFKRAETRVIKTAANAVPIKVPATPSLEVKTAASTDAIPAATALYDSTTFCDFSSSTITREIVSACYCV